ncbi:MAG TPA: hypothetical protein VF125_08005 [Solirubrobacterales bacterium]
MGAPEDFLHPVDVLDFQILAVSGELGKLHLFGQLDQAGRQTDEAERGDGAHAGMAVGEEEEVDVRVLPRLQPPVGTRGVDAEGLLDEELVDR